MGGSPTLDQTSGSAFHCPYCGRVELTKVTDSRPAQQGKARRRKRECQKCNRLFETVETATAVVVN